MLESVGWFFGITLLIVSIALVTLVVLLVMELRMSAAIPPAFVEDFTDTVNKRRFKEAYEMAKEDPSFVARVLTAGMSRLQYGIEDAREPDAQPRARARHDRDATVQPELLEGPESGLRMCGFGSRHGARVYGRRPREPAFDPIASARAGRAPQSSARRCGV